MKKITLLVISLLIIPLSLLAAENLDESSITASDIEEDALIELGEEEEIIPKVKIKAQKNKWNIYVFTPDVRGVTAENLVYSWDLGDDTFSNQKVVEHQYEQAGQYTVSLKVTGPNDLELIDSKKINISFFNWANKTLKAIVAAFIAFLIALVTAFFKGLALFGRR